MIDLSVREVESDNLARACNLGSTIPCSVFSQNHPPMYDIILTNTQPDITREVGSERVDNGPDDPCFHTNNQSFFITSHLNF